MFEMKDQYDIIINSPIVQEISINQVGYLPCDKKIAVIKGKTREYVVVESTSHKVIYNGKSVYHKNSDYVDPSSGDVVSYCDFSGVHTEGGYYLYVDGIGRSPEFIISKRVYNQVRDALMKGLYYQRCGTELEEKYAGQWKHKKCHVEPATLYNNPGKMLEVSGGWHDAGDYGRYVTAGAVSVADLFLSILLSPKVCEVTMEIPESGNGLPDILNEAKVELDWMLKMQNTETGGVYHKVTSKKFCGMVMPEEDTYPMVVCEESKVATGDFAAVMALGSMIYQKYDKDYAEKMRKASVSAWKWLQRKDVPEEFKNPEDVTTGEYGDPCSKDEVYFASVSLYFATRDEKYHDLAKEILTTDMDLIDLFHFGWSNVGGYGTALYLYMDRWNQEIRIKKENGNNNILWGNDAVYAIDQEVLKNLKEKLIIYADNLVELAKEDGYRVCFSSNDYNWGCTMELMNRGTVLCMAYEVTKNNKYIEYAKVTIDYILGCNPLSLSYITGIGSHRVNQIHHRPSVADHVEEAVPGLLVGGPNVKKNDEVARTLVMENTPPAKCYIDHKDSYSTNEVTIYWNTSALIVVSYFCQEVEMDI